MARPKISTGIDIGTQHIKVVTVQGEPGKHPRIIGRGKAESKGMRHGYILNHQDTIKSLRKAIAQAESISGIPIKRARLSVGGVGLESMNASGSTSVSRADYEVTENDIKLAQDAAESALPQSFIMNRRILHAIPLFYKLDNREVLGRPNSMKGLKLEAKMLFVTALEQHLNDMLASVEDTGIEVTDVMAAPLAAGLVNLTKPQRMAGCVLANIGAETLSMVVYENNIPLWLGVFPLGSGDVTNDIALGLQISIEEAEEAKCGVVGFNSLPNREFGNIINSRLDDMFELIEAQLKKIGKNGLLPAGIIITGGGSAFNSIEKRAKEKLRIPSRVAMPGMATTKERDALDASWSVASGLALWGLSTDEDSRLTNLNITKNLKSKVTNFIKQFLP